jgi:hypothetical protein
MPLPRKPRDRAGGQVFWLPMNRRLDPLRWTVLMSMHGGEPRPFLRGVAIHLKRSCPRVTSTSTIICPVQFGLSSSTILVPRAIHTNGGGCNILFVWISSKNTRSVAPVKLSIVVRHCEAGAAARSTAKGVAEMPPPGSAFLFQRRGSFILLLLYSATDPANELVRTCLDDTG